MKGRKHFSAIEANEIRSILLRAWTANAKEQKKLRGRLRGIGFHIADWHITGAGFTCSDFDHLVREGQITVDTDSESSPRDGAEAKLTAAPPRSDTAPRPRPEPRWKLPSSRPPSKR